MSVLETLGATVFVLAATALVALGTCAFSLWVATVFEEYTGRRATDAGVFVFVVTLCVTWMSIGFILWWLA